MMQISMLQSREMMYNKFFSNTTSVMKLGKNTQVPLADCRGMCYCAIVSRWSPFKVCKISKHPNPKCKKWQCYLSMGTWAWDVAHNHLEEINVTSKAPHFHQRPPFTSQSPHLHQSPSYAWEPPITSEYPHDRSESPHHLKVLHHHRFPTRSQSPLIHLLSRANWVLWYLNSPRVPQHPAWETLHYFCSKPLWSWWCVCGGRADTKGGQKGWMPLGGTIYWGCPLT